MIWNPILIGILLYLAVAIRGQIRHLKQLELCLSIRIASLETQIRDLQDFVAWIADRTRRREIHRIGIGDGP